MIPAGPAPTWSAGWLRRRMARVRVWVVGDDPDLLAELRDALSLSGYDAAAFSSAASVKRRLAGQIPDVILLDLKMEPESGLELAYELKHNPVTSLVPVIAMTGYYTRARHSALLDQCGIGSCLMKPFDLAEVLDRIVLATETVAAPAPGAAGESQRRAPDSPPAR